MVGFYTNNPSPLGILRVYMGYVSLLPNLVGYLVTRLPLTWSPYLLAYFALLIRVAAQVIFVLPRFRFVVANDQTRWWICLLVALVPFGDVLLVDNTTYSLWNMLWILLLLMLAPVGTSRIGQVVQFVILALFACSHPLSIVAIPIALYHLYHRQRTADRLMNAGLILVIALYWLLAVKPDADKVSSLWHSLLYTPLYVLNRVVFESLFSYHVRMWLQDAQWSWLIYAVSTVVVGGLVAWYAVQRPQLTTATRRFFLLLGYLIIGVTLASVYSRGMTAVSHMGPWNHRYFYVQQFLFLLALSVLVSKTIKTTQAATALVVVSMIYFSSLTVVNWDYLRTWQENGQQIAQFLRAVEESQNRGSQQTAPEFLLERECIDIRIRL